MKYKTLGIQIAWSCFGVSILGLAIACFIQGNIGSDAMSTCAQGLANTFHITQQTGNTIVAITCILISCIIDRNQVGLGTILQPFVAYLSIQFFLIVVPPTSNPLMSMLLFLSGLLFMGLSIAITSSTKIGKQPYDVTIFAFMKRCKRKYSTIRWAQDIIMLTIGFALGGVVGIGTLLNILFVGLFVDLFMMMIQRILTSKNTNREYPTEQI